MKSSSFELCVYLFLLFVSLAAMSGAWVFKSRMEAKSFNRLTGANVSTWDAMWVELRVDIPVIK